MSTIEKALEKLQQGGAEKLNSHNSVDEIIQSDIPVQTDDSLKSNSHIVFPPQAESESPPIRGQKSRRKDIDLESLARQGFITPESGRTHLAEEMRHIKRPLLLNSAGASNENTSANLIMVTSSKPAEGKSYTSLNLAMSIAKERDKTVLLVDADVAKPGVTRILHMENEKGLVDYLLDDTLELADVMLKTNVPNFRFIPAGKRHIHSTELLASDSMIALAHDLSKRYPDRIVIFDSPPLLATSEASVVAGLAGQIVMVVESEKTSKQELNDALALIELENRYVGLVLNKVRASFGTDYYGYYGSYGG